MFALVQSVLSFSYGNAYPEQGLSVNKQLMNSYGYVMGEKSIVSLRLIKDELHRVGGILKFPCTLELINSVKGAPAKYFASMEQKELALEKKITKKMLQQQAKEAHQSNRKD